MDNGEHYDAQLELARLRENAATGGAIAALEAALYIYPYDAQPHEDLARLYARARTGRRWRAPAARCWRSTRSTAPRRITSSPTPTGVRAIDLRRASEILYALEIAPNYVQAQELLLLALRRQRPGAVTVPDRISPASPPGINPTLEAHRWMTTHPADALAGGRRPRAGRRPGQRYRACARSSAS